MNSFEIEHASFAKFIHKCIVLIILHTVDGPLTCNSTRRSVCSSLSLDRRAVLMRLSELNNLSIADEFAPTTIITRKSLANSGNSVACFRRKMANAHASLWDNKCPARRSFALRAADSFDVTIDVARLQSVSRAIKNSCSILLFYILEVFLKLWKLKLGVSMNSIDKSHLLFFFLSDKVCCFVKVWNSFFYLKIVLNQCVFIACFESLLHEFQILMKQRGEAEIAPQAIKVT